MAGAKTTTRSFIATWTDCATVRVGPAHWGSCPESHPRPICCRLPSWHTGGGLVPAFPNSLDPRRPSPPRGAAEGPAMASAAIPTAATSESLSAAFASGPKIYGANVVWARSRIKGICQQSGFLTSCHWRKDSFQNVDSLGETMVRGAIPAFSRNIRSLRRCVSPPPTFRKNRSPTQTLQFATSRRQSHTATCPYAPGAPQTAPSTRPGLAPDVAPSARRCRAPR